ncbi:hypothetical protein F5148DRAFT_1296338 [Russula earlei]|uniref:Uncharacterized protein n=1 Tax=Russula earlei TaxID=71964 RepID=A0ACC0TQB7_9AGAM|nr:hypothetical protein F5148DRAFT_1296338 [Russula earlei]
MGTENFWKQLKHNHLHHMLQPRLDLLVWILVTKVTPKYIACAEVLEDTHHLGHSKPLSSYQKCFKSSWKQLTDASVSRNIYVTDVTTWMCNCGQQMYHSQHLCKHLVQSVQPPPMHFWHQVVCHHILPLYCHPALVSNIKVTDVGHPDPNEGSITNGDNHVWMGNPDMLVEGQWREFDLEEEVQGLLNDGDESDLKEELQIKINALSIWADKLVEAAEII